MSTLSVPLPATLGDFVETMVKRGFAPNKAAVVRRALVRLAEEEAIAAVLKAEQEVTPQRTETYVRKSLRRDNTAVSHLSTFIISGHILP